VHGKAILAICLASATPLGQIPNGPVQQADQQQRCTAQGGFGFRFGQAEDEVPKIRMATQNSRFARPPPGDWLPFEDFEVVFTSHGRRLFSINATARFADDAAARSFATAEAKRFANLAPAEKNGASDAVHYQSVAPDDGKPLSGFSIEIEAQGTQVFLTCTDIAMKRIAWSEALGHYRLDKAPVPPALRPPARPALDACATTEGKAAMISGFESNIENALAFAQAGNRYGDELLHWKGQQLVDKGVWTEKQESAFAAQLLLEPQFLAYFQNSLNLTLNLMKPLGALDDARKAGNEQAQCQAAVDGINAMHDLIDSVFKHWQFTIDRYDAVAKARGVSLI